MGFCTPQGHVTGSKERNTAMGTRELEAAFIVLGGPGSDALTTVSAQKKYDFKSLISDLPSHRWKFSTEVEACKNPVGERSPQGPGWWLL
jgi:hypothetical protein